MPLRRLSSERPDQLRRLMVLTRPLQLVRRRGLYPRYNAWIATTTLQHMANTSRADLPVTGQSVRRLLSASVDARLPACARVRRPAGGVIGIEGWDPRVL